MPNLCQEQDSQIEEPLEFFLDGPQFGKGNVLNKAVDPQLSSLTIPVDEGSLKKLFQQQVIFCLPFRIVRSDFLLETGQDDLLLNGNGIKD
jgi:hypothetical protein